MPNGFLLSSLSKLVLGLFIGLFLQMVIVLLVFFAVVAPFMPITYSFSLPLWVSILVYGVGVQVANS